MLSQQKYLNGQKHFIKITGRKLRMRSSCENVGSPMFTGGLVQNNKTKYKISRKIGSSVFLLSVAMKFILHPILPEFPLHMLRRIRHIGIFFL